MSSGYKKIVEQKYALNCIAKYFHYLRKVKRGEIKEVPVPYKIFNEGNKIISVEYKKITGDKRELMNRLIQINLLDKDYLCTECHLIFEDVEDYYNHLPWIIISKGNGIELVCDDEKCRESAIRRFVKSGRLLKEY